MPTIKPYTHLKSLLWQPAAEKAVEDTSDGYLVRGYMTTMDVDRDSEVMVTKGIENWDEFSANPVLLYNHGPQIGHALTLRREEHRIYAESLLAKGHELVETVVWPLVRSGSLKTHSIGFTGVEGHEEKGVWYHDRWKLFEYSLVTIPANPSAQAWVKSLGIELAPTHETVLPYADLPCADEAFAWEPLAARKRVAEWAGDDDAAFARAFLCSTPETKGRQGYRLQVADVVDGELRCVWQALAAAACRLSGAKGGAGIGAAETSVAWERVGRYYGKYGRALPERGKGFAETDWQHDEKAVFEAVEATDAATTARGLLIGVRDLGRGYRKAGRDLPAPILAAARDTQEALEDLLQPPTAGEPSARDLLRERLRAGTTQGA